MGADALAALQQLLEHGCSAPGALSTEARRAAARWTSPHLGLSILLQAIESDAAAITDSQVEALRRHFTDDELYEAMVAGSIASGLRRLQAGLQAVRGTP